jgi:hypothetical protein
MSINPFQLVLLVLIGSLLVGSIVALIKGWFGRREGLIWLAVWLAAGVTVLWPNVTSRLAKAVGIGRGADLVFYCAILVLLCGIWMLYIRLRRVRREITLLVRHVALLDAERELASDKPLNAASKPDGRPGNAQQNGE